MIEYISDLKLFLTISRTLNFREAGERLGYSPAVVTSRIQRLEAMTGKTLFFRSTRQIRLTEEGHQMVSQAEQLVDLSESMSRPKYHKFSQTSLKGRVRISAPHSLARLFLVEPLKELIESHPEIMIDLILEDTISRIIEEEIDISFRVGGALESHTESQDLFADKRILIASPEYLTRHGTPESHLELSHHQCLAFPHTKKWTLCRDERNYAVPLQSVMNCNSGDFMAQLVRAGCGIACKSHWSVQSDLDNRRLVQVLPDYTVDNEHNVKAIFPKRDYLPARVTYVLEVVKKYMAEKIGDELMLS